MIDYKDLEKLENKTLHIKLSEIQKVQGYDDSPYKYASVDIQIFETGQRHRVLFKICDL